MTQKNNTKRKNSKDVKNSKYGNTKKRNNKNKNSKNHFSKNKKNSYVMNGGNICELFSKPSISSAPPIPPKPSIPPKSSPIPLQRKNSVATNKPLVYKGIINFGNTCYMNSTLQMLWSIPEFRNFLTSITLENIENFSFKTRTYKHPYTNKVFEYDYNIDKEALISLFKIFEYLQNQNKAPFEMTRNIYDGLRNLSITQGFFSILNKEGKYATEIFNGKKRNIVKLDSRISFRYKDQEDASEFLVKIMQDLLPNIIDNPIVTELLNTFEYEEKSIVTCEYTNTQTTSVNKSFNLDIPIKSNNLTQSLQDFLKIENIDNYLEYCKSEANLNGIMKNKKIQIDFTKNTTNLIIKLKRFDSSTNKIKTYMNPEVILDFNTIDPNNPQDVLFSLQGCIIHLGATMSSGHYEYLVFDDNGKPKFIISDSSKTDVDDKYNTYLTDGYIYYYRRIEI